MLRRLYFLLPDESHAEIVVAELHQSGIQMHAISAVANEQHALKNLPRASASQRQDQSALIESLLWHTNLWLFFLALVLFIVTLISANFAAAAGLSIFMLLSFFAGERFVTKLPHTHLDNFTGAIQHGEVLLMVDVPFYRVKEVGDMIHRQHPEAQLGGSCWSIDALGI